MVLEPQALLDASVANSQAELARHCGLTRASVTQLLKVLDLPHSVLTHFSELPEPEQVMYTERRLRPVTDLHDSGSRLQASEGVGLRTEGELGGDG